MNSYKMKLLKERILLVQSKLDTMEIRLAVLLANKNEKALR